MHQIQKHKPFWLITKYNVITLGILACNYYESDYYIMTNESITCKCNKEQLLIFQLFVILFCLPLKRFYSRDFVRIPTYIPSLNYHLNIVNILFKIPTNYHGFVRGSMKSLNWKHQQTWRKCRHFLASTHHRKYFVFARPWW